MNIETPNHLPLPLKRAWESKGRPHCLDVSGFFLFCLANSSSSFKAQIKCPHSGADFPSIPHSSKAY